MSTRRKPRRYAYDRATGRWIDLRTGELIARPRRLRPASRTWQRGADGRLRLARSARTPKLRGPTELPDEPSPLMKAAVFIVIDLIVYAIYLALN